jgi:hypothetical protein
MTQDTANKRIQLDLAFSPAEFKVSFDEWNEKQETLVILMTIDEALTFLIDDPFAVIQAYITKNFEFFYNDLMELQDEEGIAP